MDRATIPGYDFLKQLIECQTVHGENDAFLRCLSIIDRYFSSFSLFKKEFEEQGKRSVFYSTIDTLTPDVLLYAHLDVVPGSADQFSLQFENDHLIGRGVSDMKFAVSAFYEVLKTILAEHTHISIGILFVTDEEIGGRNGAGYLVQSVGIRPKVVVMPDGGDNWHLVKEAKGAAWFTVEANGKSAHGSRPWEGENAILRLVDVLTTIMRWYPSNDPNHWGTTVNIGYIEGGTVTNQVPDKAKAKIDFRTVYPDSADSLKKRMCDHFPSVSVGTDLDNGPFSLPENTAYVHQWINSMKKVVKNNEYPDEVFVRERGGADHHYFSQFDIPVLVSKPIGGGIHTNEEWLSLSSYKQYIEVLIDFLREIAKVS